MTEERFDIFDESGQQIGVEARSEVHRKGDWHQTFHCWLYRVHNGQLELLFQKRHPEKDTGPNLLDITSAGHLLAGERPCDGVRELEEELGLVVPYEKLRQIGVIRDVITAPGIIDKELCHVFAMECDQPLHEYRLQKEEVTGLLWVNVQELEALFADQLSQVAAKGFLTDAAGERYDASLMVKQSDFVPHEVHYYQEVFQAIKSWL
ncbi:MULTISPECIES: NUDIX hydrolase [Brevibacillus]|jgi:isopentenyldiphosphate isomerase|uniref:Putative Nudix hydrolase n=1 Tax=Brevibacillus parabrevis TaxID=54914 RepID=A0A4Y3PT17_BREPA|nr:MULTISPECIES: NUDIX domain-containing protein [Brevibacillus]MBU8712996.1 NUDIX domain-containing protein [Brevibacillus parabrevis]MDR5002338.1 NUDIX domain-containing protein [Brevibacillus parabrevis]MED2256395.1 NUDIX domain-containing protein [Brevibacillus parabrevis]NRQ53024.1 NUDIX domain-containing protein [Brevibacillus sp. HD1.4A]RNB96847.1 NUDIX domain-containing protein [Brevibacillus parabrevis]